MPQRPQNRILHHVLRIRHRPGPGREPPMGPAAQWYDVAADQDVEGVLVAGLQPIEQLCRRFRIGARRSQHSRAQTRF